MISLTSVTLFALAYVSCLVNGSLLVGRAKLDVVAPPVTYPTKGVVWKAGETQTVTWDVSNLPAQISNPIGEVVLGWLEGDGLNLQLDAPLAEGFPITAGKVNIVVPSQYPDRDTYIIVLIGDSGNASPTFTITGGSTGGSSSSGTVDLPPSTTSSPPAQPTSVPGTPPSTTPVHSSSVSSLSLSSVLSSGTQRSSGGSAGSANSARGNRPTNKMTASLLVASLVTFFL